LQEEVDLEFTKDNAMSRLIVLALSCAAAVLLAACGGSSKTATHAAAVTNTAATSAGTPATTPTSGSSTAATQTSAAPAGPPLCRAGDLALSFLGGQGATGHGELGFELRNTSARTCTTYGYPGVQFLDRAGAALPTTPTHTTTDFFGSLPKASLAIAPGAITSFRLGVTHGAASTAGCTTAYGLQVIPPNDTATLRTAIGNGGAFECQTTTVSPLQPGTTAYA
jgi:hypothetical protein